MKKIYISIIAIFLVFPLFSQTFGNAIELDGTNDFALVPHHPSLNPGNGSWSVAFWLKAADKPQISPVVLKRFPGGGYTMYAYCFGSGDPHNADYGRKIRINHIEDAGITERSGVTSGEYIDGDWHHYVIIADKQQNEIIIYVDGQAVEFIYVYNLGGWPTVENEEPLFIARGSGETYLEGDLDELSIWNKAISPELIQKMQTDTLSSPYYNSVDSGLVAYYRFDKLENLGSGNSGIDDIRDLSSYQNHADAEGEPALVESTILPSNDASLKEIKVNNEKLLDFTTLTLNYSVELPRGTTDLPSVTASPNDSNASIIITQVSELPGKASILVTAENGENQKTYSVEFTVTPNDDATLNSIQINIEELSDFDKDILEYIIEYSTLTGILPTVTASANDTNAIVVITQSPQLPGTATILISAEDGETQISYTIDFIIPTKTIDFDLKNEILLYPNPTQGKLKVESLVFIVEEATIEFYDLNGRKLFKKQIRKGTETIEIDVNHLQNGFYFCRINTDHISLTRKIIIQK